ncbi:glutamyl-Q-tRNA(Asp) synthetase [Microlunatus phosphovorus NM-1]|uniref:Glutamyl-Q tRNA(Asp) synthetase n=1 Tax=Microlunatus phosphovorus (strain ATCC 700054 / DSM 10555 / JCM 9379 / NBRC 101784 / NCIMB 13414 / VKM Ac-1990 / NM-1) TaxID=1032480 RepID=F5XS91_MICPN|nr:tRNA glutamyl-Q(34) synthetase GluQRS [Microlunatus phosphovorus]BAK34772.1 glutamyl-Q-tRNA(Asp) synthetase [Microlunatus phosphovorus NM-1]
MTWPGTTGVGAGRYAPSPTGDLHLGNLRTGLLAWLFARSTGRRFLLRFEDLDTGRVRPGVADRQRTDLASLGIDFDPPLLVQSERAAVYADALTELARGGLTYECYCTRREIAEAASAPHSEPGRYPGTCRELTEAERAERRRTGREPALRIRADRAEVTITDLLQGEVTGLVDDVVVRRNDGVAAYQLAVVVDDGATGVDQVVRGDDLLSSAVTQAWLARQLGLPVPTYAHVPLALNSEGRRLAKRDGAVTLADLAPLGWTADRVLGLLATSLNLAEPGEPVTTTALLHRFDPERLPCTPWIVRPAELVSPPK